MPRADNSLFVIAAGRRRAAATHKRAVSTLRRMDKAGLPITFDAVAREALLTELIFFGRWLLYICVKFLGCGLEVGPGDVVIDVMVEGA